MGNRNKSSMDYTSLVCCALAFVLYLNTLDAGFVYDDRRTIIGNTDVSGKSPWPYIFRNDYWGTPLTDSGSHGSYRPLCVLSFKMNYLIGGYNPWGYHLINNLMHCLATGLVVKLARHLLSSMWGILATGALFAAHPIHTEAVAGIVGRADLAACILYLLTYLMYIKHMTWRERGDSKQWPALGLTIFLSVCAILCKETAVTALIACALYDIIRGLCGITDKNRYCTLGIIVASFITIMYIRLSLPGPTSSFSTADNPIAKSNSVWTRFLTFLYLPAFNFQLLLFPKILSFDWGMDAIPRITTIYDSRNLLTFSFYTCIIIILWITCKLLYSNYRLNFPRVAQQRKSRTKKKLPIMNQNNNPRTEYYFVYNTNNNNNNNNYYNNYNNINNNNNNNNYNTNSTQSHNNLTQLGTSKMLIVKRECVCRICKQELTTIRHTSSCRAINNNNIPGPHTECGCQVIQGKYNNYNNNNNNNSASRSNSPSSNNNNNNNNNDSNTRNNNLMSLQQKESSTRFKIASIFKTSMASTISSKKEDFKRNYCLHEEGRKHSMNLLIKSNKCCATRMTKSNSNGNSNNSNNNNKNYNINSNNLCNMLKGTDKTTSNCTIILISVAFLTLPFLPATNIFFYVGFVVAERLLYLPSVGYCLLIGFGVSKIMELLKNTKRKIIVILCMSLTLSLLSIRTWKRNLDWRDEESLYRSAIEVNPPKALGNLGSVLSSQGRYLEAEIVLKEALKYRPNMADVHFNLGILHQNQQNFKSAIENFQRAIQFRPNLALAYLNLGTSLIALGRCQEAARVLKEGTKIDGTGVRDRISHENARMSSYLQLGSLYAEQGKLQRALAVYKEALHSLPTNYQKEVLYTRIGDIFGKLQQWNEAEKYHRAALELRPDHVAAHLSYGIALAKNSSRASEAEQWFKRALNLAPNQASVYHHYAEFLTSFGRNEEAIEYRIRAAELSPKDYSLTVAVATALRVLDRKSDAERWYRRAVHLRPNDARAHTNLGAILHLQGHTQKAAASYKEALRLQPGDPTTLGNLAKLGIIQFK